MKTRHAPSAHSATLAYRQLAQALARQANAAPGATASTGLPTWADPAAIVAVSLQLDIGDRDRPQLDVVLANDAVMVGSAVGADGAVSAAKSVYATSDTVHASVPVGGYAPGKEVAMYWFSSKGGSIKDERKPIPAGAKYVNFSLAKADGMEAGTYTAQADIDDNPVGMADFTVK